jgi:hypothetical protein
MTTVIRLQELRTRTFRSAGMINEPPVVVDEPKFETPTARALRIWLKHSNGATFVEWPSKGFVKLWSERHG